MGMFDKYDNLAPDYEPNNSSLEPSTNFLTIDSDLPRPLFDPLNNQIGYTWDSSERFLFEVCVNDMISILDDSLVYDEVGAGPDNYTVAKRMGQQAYNTIDAKSWTYVGRSDAVYIWIEDNELTYPDDGDKSIIIHADMRDKHIEVDILNFRRESVYHTIGESDANSVSINFNDELAETLGSGVYTCNVSIVSENSSFLKDSFVINII